MKVWLVVLGVVLVAVGGVLLFVPVSSQPSQTVSNSAGLPFYIGQISGYSITGTIPVSVSWTATAAVDVIAAACSSGCSSGNVTGSVTDLTLQQGTSGSFTLNQPNNGYIVMGVANETGTPPGTQVTFKITTALTEIGLVLIVVGVILLIVGAVIGKKPAPLPPSAPSVPAPTPAPGGLPPAPPPGTFPPPPSS